MVTLCSSLITYPDMPVHKSGKHSSVFSTATSPAVLLETFLDDHLYVILGFSRDRNDKPKFFLVDGIDQIGSTATAVSHGLSDAPIIFVMIRLWAYLAIVFKSNSFQVFCKTLGNIFFFVKTKRYTLEAI